MPFRSLFTLRTGYLLLEYIEEDQARMLSESWEEKREDKAQRSNLFRGLSKMILSVGHVPLPKTGSFTVGDDGVLTLTNRPLTCRLHMLENDHVLTKIQRDSTYTSVESYCHDLLVCHQRRLLDQPNSCLNENDCREQVCAILGMRMVMPQFLLRSLE